MGNEFCITQIMGFSLELFIFKLSGNKARTPQIIALNSSFHTF